MENNIAPLDNDTITRLVYAHDDELTEAIRQIRVLMDRVKELEEIKSSQKVVTGRLQAKNNRIDHRKTAVLCDYFW